MSIDNNILVMITDVSTRKSFDLANILTNQGIEILLCDDINKIDAAILQNAYGKKLKLLRKDEHFTQDLVSIIEENPSKKLVYFPIEEDTTILVYEFLKDHKYKNFYHNLPPQKAFDTVRDKGVFSAFCIDEKLPVPKEYNYKNLKQQEQIPTSLIIKPRSGSGSVGIRFIDTKEELLACKALPMQEYIIQERLLNPRDVEGAFFLFDQGKMISYYGHKRIRTFPASGGVSIYSKCELKPELQKLGCDLLERLQWSGLAMVEFLYDATEDKYKIIEVNPRLWGSLMLSEFCGANMMTNYCLSALKEPIEKTTINQNTYIRWFFPWELLGYIQSKGRIENFWNFDTKHTCYINTTYTSYWRSFLFTFYNIINPAKLKRLYQKVFS